MNDSCPQCRRQWGSRGKYGGLIKHYAKGLCKSCYGGRVPYRQQAQTLDDPALHKRFWAKVDVRSIDECWLWTASTNDTGYGMFMFNGAPFGAHRMSWAIENQKLPGKLDVCHTCDRPSCVNPKHLWLGTRKQNHRDMVRKGRHSTQKAKTLFVRVLSSVALPEQLREDIHAYLKTLS